MTKESTDPPVRWIYEVERDGALAFRAGRRGGDLVADWPGLGRLTCARDGSAATFSPVSGAADAAVRKLQRAQVRGLLRDLTGQLAVHASAVSIGGRAVLFLGSDGAGKSTAAAEMCLRHGAQMLADDAAAIEVGESGVFVVPCEEEHWLTRDSRVALGLEDEHTAPGGDKRRMRASFIAREPCRLGLVVALRFDPTIAAPTPGPLRGSAAAQSLLEAVIRFDVEDGVARRRELGQLTSVHSSAPFLELVRPLRAPGGVAAYVLEALGGAF
jgi:hypothetical protein